MDIAKVDYKFVPSNPDPGFSPERNKSVIEGTIKKYERVRAQKMKKWREGVAERSDALAQYFTSPKFLSTPFGKYFGKKWMAYLRGEQALKEVNNRIKANTNQLYQSLKYK